MPKERLPISYDHIPGGNVIEVGMILDDVVKKWKEQFDKALEKNRHIDSYYMFIHADWYNNYTMMKILFCPRDRCPPKMLNTMCFKVDNRKGTVEELWVLPKDAPIPQVGEIAEPVPQLMAVAPFLPLDY